METQNSQSNETAYKAVVLTGASKSIPKSNGGSYVLHKVKITEGPLAGKIVDGNRTLVNREGQEKEGVEKNQEIVVYPSKEGTKWFFGIGTLVPATSDEEIDALMNGVVEPTAQEQIDSQAI